MRISGRLAAIGAGLALAIWAGGAQAEPLKVVASFSILGDLVHQVGGDDVALTTLVGAGGDAHVYQPTPADARAIAEARLVVVNGLGMEGWMDRLIKAAGGHAEIVTASRGVAAKTMTEEEEGGKARVVTDPHAWQDLANGRLYVRNIAAALSAADPVHAADYAKRAAALDAQLVELDGWVRSRIAEVPAPKRKIITTHDAFGYFGRAYKVVFKAPLGISTEAEPTPAGLAALARQIKSEKIKALFIETMTDPRMMESLARETGATIGGALYSDTLSPPDGPAPTYVAMFRHNVPAMVEAMNKN